MESASQFRFSVGDKLNWNNEVVVANRVWSFWLKKLCGRSTMPRRVRPGVCRLPSHTAAEALESRVLLSAHSSRGAAAEISHAKATFTPPNVAGTWNITVVGIGGGTGTVVMTQKGTKVTSVITIPGNSTLISVDKFSKSDPHSLVGTSKVRLPVVGKVVYNLNIEFAENPTPTTLTGDITVFGNSFPIAGTRQ